MPRAGTGEPLLQEHAALESDEIRDVRRCGETEARGSCFMQPLVSAFSRGKALGTPPQL